MATTTPNFGWSVPTSTDLVKDGATAIETLGDSIDASLVDLKGGTTGQVLAKNSNTDMDFNWIAVDPLTILDAKGDLITATAADTPARLPVGTNGQVLTASSGAATGLAWSTLSSGKLLQVVYGSTGTSVTSTSNTYIDTGLTATITPSSITSKILVLVNQAGVYKSGSSASEQVSLRLLRDATSVLTFARDLTYTGTTLELVSAQSTAYLDSPATTSATTYKTQFNSSLNAGQVRVQVAYGSVNTSTIILMEIGA